MCVFCKKNKEDYFIERPHVAAIYNISPILPGHSLVIPKRHVESLFDLNDVELNSLMQLGRDVAKLLSIVFETDAFNWAIQEKEASGQSVPHLHMHVVPRKIGDLTNPGGWYQELEKSKPLEIDTYNRFKLNEDQLRELTSRLRSEANKLMKL